MKLEFFKDILIFIMICLVQVLVLNHIHLLNCAMPLLYVYFALLFPYNYPRWAVLVWCFLMGLVMDVFSNTPGVAAASMTLVGLLQPMFFGAFVQHDNQEEVKPHLRSMGFTAYFSYAAALVLIYCVVYFSLEAFHFFNWLQWLKNIGGSALLTLILIFVIESVVRKDSE